MNSHKPDTSITRCPSEAYAPKPRQPKLKRFDKVGGLTLLNRFYKNRKDWWECQCQCGKVKNIRGDSLRNGNTKSCGCLKGMTNTARRKQTASYPVKHGQVKYRVYGYQSNGFRPGANRKLMSVGFYTIAKVGDAPDEYYLSHCGSFGIPRGQVPLLMEEALKAMHGNDMIGPQGTLTVPQWADAYGVEYKTKLRSGQNHIRDTHAELEDAQDFAYKGIRL